MENLTTIAIRSFWVSFGITMVLPYVQKFFNKTADIDIKEVNRVRQINYPLYYPVLYFLFILAVVGLILVPSLLMEISSLSFLTSKAFTGYVEQQQLSGFQFLIFLIYALLPLLIVLLSFGLLVMSLLIRILPKKFQDYDLKRMYESGWRVSDNTMMKELWKITLIMSVIYLTMTILFYFKILHF